MNALPMNGTAVRADVLTVHEAAEFLRVSVGTVIWAAWRGQLPTVRRGAVLVIDRSELLRMLNRSRGPSR